MIENVENGGSSLTWPTESSPPYMLGLTAFLAGVIPKISRSFK